MACESLPGSQFWERLLLLLTDPSRRAALLEVEHAPYLETVPFRIIAAFTLLQLVCMLGVYGLTWAGIAGAAVGCPGWLLLLSLPHLLQQQQPGSSNLLSCRPPCQPLPHHAPSPLNPHLWCSGILFPIPIMLCVPLRQYVLPRWFKPAHLQELDALHTEVADPLPRDLALAEAEHQGMGHAVPSKDHEPEDELLPLPEEEAAGLHVVRHIARRSVLRRSAAAEVEASPQRSAHELARLFFPPHRAVSNPRRRSLTLPGTGSLDGAV